MSKCNIILITVIFILWVPVNSLNADMPGKTLSGKITDKNTGEPIAGVTVYLPDFKTGTISGNDGTYFLENLPAAKVLLQLSIIGYKTRIETIDLNLETVRNFTLEYVATELNEVVVTGTSQAAEQKRMPVPVTIVSRLALLENASANIIDAIAHQPGISQVTTGAGISKPVIRGLGYNRVVVVNDGIRQEGQQWGDEHGIEIDEFTVNKVEILKGPSSLAYGSDAMAGVINMLSTPGLPNGKVEGSLSTNYQTNNGLLAYSADFAGNKNGFIWDLRYSDKLAHAYRNKYDGYVFNSGFKENALTAMAGFNKSWGYSTLLFNMYHLQPGIVEGERDSLSGKFVKQVVDASSQITPEIAVDRDFKSYTPLVPFQNIHHYKAVMTNNILLGQGSLKAVLGFQQNQRQEYGDPLNPGQYGLYFLLNTFNYDIRYVFPEKNGFSLSAGANGMSQESSNKGTEFLVPEYRLFDAGVFTIIRKNLGPVDLSGGLRYDARHEIANSLYLNVEGLPVEASSPGRYQKFASFNTVFSGFSGSLGATWQISESLFTKINLARGYRAPNIAELGSNGIHEGTLRYEEGNPNLKPEYSLQWDYSMGLSREHVSAELNIFDNMIQNFIYAHKLSSAIHADSISEGYSTYAFDSGKARLFGGEFRIDLHPHPFDWIHFENTFSFVSATQLNQPDSTHYLPLTPAPKWQTSIKLELKKYGKIIRNAYFRIDADKYFAQTHYYSAGGTETMTPGYTLINIAVGTDIVKKESTICTLHINLNNLADVAYQSHLSRLKYAPENYLTGRSGVYNMGRNVSFMLIIPIRFIK